MTRVYDTDSITLPELMAIIKQNSRECGDCLIWMGSTSGGDGKVGVPKYRNRSLRRLLFAKRTNRPVPSNKLVTATCDTPNCLAHLRLTNKHGAAVKGHDNAGTRARLSASNRRVSRSRPGVKLSEEKAEYIRTSDKSCRAMAAELGVDKTLISKVRRGQSWAPTGPFAGMFSQLVRG